MRGWLTNLGLAALALALSCAAAEGVLRLLPVNEGLRALPVNAANPVLRFEPNAWRTSSAFGDMAMATRVRVNNAGFVNAQDYDPAAPGPLVAVVGDSYVEAAMVPWADTLQGRLAADLRGRARVYSFGCSGAALPQYLAYAASARDAYHPALGIVVVVGNDFDESLLAYKAAPGLHAFRPGADGRLDLVRLDYEPGPLRRLLAHSRLGLYLANNLGLGSLPARLHALLAPREDFVGQTSASLDTQRVQDSLAAIDAFVERLPGAFGLPPEKLLLVLDAPRPELYDPARLAAAQGSYFGRMRSALLQRARAAHIRVADMQEAFGRDYARRGQRFEFPRDGHWNAYGHEAAARAVLESGLLEGL